MASKPTKTSDPAPTTAAETKSPRRVTEDEVCQKCAPASPLRHFPQRCATPPRAAQPTPPRRSCAPHKHYYTNNNFCHRRNLARNSTYATARHAILHYAPTCPYATTLHPPHHALASTKLHDVDTSTSQCHIYRRSGHIRPTSPAFQLPSSLSLYLGLQICHCTCALTATSLYLSTMNRRLPMVSALMRMHRRGIAIGRQAIFSLTAGPREPMPVRVSLIQLLRACQALVGPQTQVIWRPTNRANSRPRKGGGRSRV